MKLILAVSADGYLCNGEDDDLRWTSPLNKFVFKLLTLSDGEPLLAGSKTYKMLPSLPGRHVVEISRQYKDLVGNPGRMSLQRAHDTFPQAWLLGGPRTARAALASGFVDRAFICRSPAKLGGGMPYDEFLAEHMPKTAEHKLCVEGIEILVYVEHSGWPEK